MTFQSSVIGDGLQGKARWDLKRTAYTNDTAADGLPSDNVGAIDVSLDGVLWFGVTQITRTMA